jgi:AcrR family transcriptional regulator
MKPSRRRRDPETVRRAILAAARQLFVREGYSNVSMRKIAERTDYSAAAIYLYFAGKDAIFYALAAEGFARLRDALAVPVADADPLLALEQRVWRHFEFSTRQPEYFWLMFVDRSVPRLSRQWAQLARTPESDAEGANLVRACVAAGLLPAGTNAGAAFQVLTSAVLGAAVARLSGRFRSRDEAETLARDTLRAVIAGLRAGVRLDMPS